jgi:hypothetical protein
VCVLGIGREGYTHAEEGAVHEDVTVLGEPARLERAIVILLELAELAQRQLFAEGSGPGMFSSGVPERKTL